MSTFTVSRVWNALPDVFQVTAVVALCTLVLSVPILFLVGLVASIKPALRAGENSAYMRVLGSYCMPIVALLFGLSSSHPTTVDRRMDKEARAKYGVIDSDPVALRGGAVCLYGSSTFTYWSRASNDLGLSQVFNSAFGGS